MITALDTLLVLWLQKLGIRYLEAFVLALIVVIAVCFGAEMFMAKPDVMRRVARGLVPRIDGRSLYIAVAMLGATVMPHNLYLHSALVQTRRIGRSVEEKRDRLPLESGGLRGGAERRDVHQRRDSDSGRGDVLTRAHQDVTEIQQAYLLLAPLLGTVVAAKLFGIALFCSGQSSTLTGTMAGQIVMEGFLNIRVQPWLRRLVTRSLAIVPAIVVIWLMGNRGTFRLLHSQPGGAESAVAFRHHSAAAFHQRPAAHGRVRQRLEAAARRLGNRGDRGRPEYVAGAADHRGLGEQLGPVCAAGLELLAADFRRLCSGCSSGLPLQPYRRTAPASPLATPWALKPPRPN